MSFLDRTNITSDDLKKTMPKFRLRKNKKNKFKIYQWNTKSQEISKYSYTKQLCNNWKTGEMDVIKLKNLDKEQIYIINKKLYKIIK